MYLIFGCCFSGIVGLNNIKANDYCNVILQVSLTFFFFLFWCPFLNLLYSSILNLGYKDLISFIPVKSETSIHEFGG